MSTTPSVARIALSYLTAVDRYPSIRAPRGWRPPEGDGECPDEDERLEILARESMRAVRKFLLPALRSRGWKIAEAWVDSEPEEMGEIYSVPAYIVVSAKAGQTIGLGGRKCIVLDRSVKVELEDLACASTGEIETLEQSEQWDVDEFSEWTEDVLCPPEEPEFFRYAGKQFPMSTRGVEQLLALFDRWLLRHSGIRSKVQKRAEALSLQPDYGLSDEPAGTLKKGAKRFRLTPKEIRRAETVHHGDLSWTYTIISRPQEDGSYLVAAIDVNTGLPWSMDPIIVDNKSAVSTAARSILRWISKMGWASKMASSSRHRRASTNTERYFYKASDGKWYVDNESYEEDWDTGEQIEGEMTSYGPFTSFRAADKWMDQNFANSGGFQKDDSGRQRPPRKPVKPRRNRWAHKKDAFNKYNPDDLLSALVEILEKYDLDDVADSVKKLTPEVQMAWRSRDR